jgi:hypothetical protein
MVSLGLDKNWLFWPTMLTSNNLKRAHYPTLSADMGFHYELKDVEESTDVASLGDKALDKEVRLRKSLLGSMKSIRIVEIREFNCSRREILDFVNNMERLELIVSEKESDWGSGKASQMGCEWRWES